MPLSSALDFSLRATAIGAIRAYQRWLSPRKGFRCAHHAVHGLGSCSQFGLTVFRAHAFGQARALLAERLRACRLAYQTYAQQAQEREEDARKRKDARGPSSAGASRAPCDCSFAPDAIPTSIGDCLPAGGCELGGCDIGSCSW